MIAAVSIEGLVGTAAAFDIDIHNARPHKGQIKAGFHEPSWVHSRPDPGLLTRFNLLSELNRTVPGTLSLGS